MDEFTPAELLEQLRQLDEQPRIEAKRASDIGRSVMQTICAFANEPGLGGGYLLLGIDEPKNPGETFSVYGVTDADALLNTIQSNCREQFEAPIPVPLFSTNEAANDTSNTSDLTPNTSDLIPNTSDFPVPNELTQRIEQLTSKSRKDKLWPIIVWLCALRPYKAEQLASQLTRKESPLKHNHLNVLRAQEGLIDYLHPEVVNHPNLAYRTTAKGLQWLKTQGIDIDRGIS
ncbi:putative DNA binding domain-containing protein [Pectobacterium aroidearum]|uniref:DNA binding domain-containing protein n=1 Tax=Pectobacterium aroidearum TaxID=1201031 RepID=A0ABR5ZIW0_9GAMM|nr:MULTISPECIES: RNA-binding domain-containing protein [Pectobacterium]MBA5201615.1 putative DNA binding domain-containing protein [Pectobacterium aroidearum]MBA5229894.1 putative DNA binding domain-containing protein [Pectobacterium aroidearum]MBA5234406.1 putative DNA binding domain-containing protein [Pectobacterium aroidearum]MBA5739581.1 putative DNA binding domain-containing protein [Pectobacterium aroidearum]UXK00412.1 putative DNA binding domain-containing protein [Pectobacterium aroid